MNTELIELISNQIVKLSIVKTILSSTTEDKAKFIIKKLTNIDIENLEKQLNQ